MATVTRVTLREAIWREVGLTRVEAERFVEAVIEETIAALAAGETVKIHRLGTLEPRLKAARHGRNPRTLEPASIPARRVVAFRPSLILRRQVTARLSGVGDGPRRDA